MNKNIFLLVDNRNKPAEDSPTEPKGAPLIDFKSSAFKGSFDIIQQLK